MRTRSIRSTRRPPRQRHNEPRHLTSSGKTSGDRIIDGDGITNKGRFKNGRQFRTHLTEESPGASPPRVTGLREDHPDRVRVELDGAAWRTLPVSAVVAAELRVGSELDRHRARTLRRALRHTGALDAAAKALSRRDRSVGETQQLLAGRGFTADERQQAVDSLAQLGYLDDARFTKRTAASLAGRGYGDEGIRFHLERHGVARELIEEALAGLATELERAQAVVEGLDHQKAYRRLASKGFSPEVIEAAAGIADDS